MSPRIYLDNNATTLMAPEVIEVMKRALSLPLGNSSSAHSFGQKSRGLIAEARSSLANHFKVKPQEVIFTSGGTEAINLLLKGYYLKKRFKHAITSNLEHLAVLESMKWMEKQGCRVSFLKPLALGAVTAEMVEEAICPDTGLIALMAVNNETGVQTDLEAIAAVAKRHGVPLFVDGVAWLGKEEIDLSRTGKMGGISGICFSGHKIHAPAGIGLMIVDSKIALEPLLSGGGQEMGRRPGTENVVAILALAEAVKLSSKSLLQSADQMAYLRDLLEYGLLEIPGATVNGMGAKNGAYRICNTSNVSFSGVDGEALLMSLDMRGLAVSHGSACSSGAREPSRVLLQMGLDPQLAASSIRFSLSRYTTKQEIEAAIQIVKETVLILRSHSAFP